MNNKRIEKPKYLLGIQPSGSIHLGNYLGAIAPTLRAASAQSDIFVMIADLHSLTSAPEAEVLRRNTLETAKLLKAVAPGAAIFTQSSVGLHGDIGFALSTLAGLGRLERMAQFKDKRQTAPKTGGLLTYPALMAADILLYEPEYLMVGADQEQHLELARDIAKALNRKGGNFSFPATQSADIRIMDLQDPARKMSKSSPSALGRIDLTDSPEAIAKKIRKAVTDEAGIANLREIVRLMEFGEVGDRSNSEMKDFLGREIAEALKPIREAHEATDDAEIADILQRGKAAAKPVAEAQARAVKTALGLL